MTLIFLEQFFKKRKALYLILLLSFLMFFKGLFVFFVQDDFFLLKISSIHSSLDFFRLFIPLMEVPWYRPLSSQVFFGLGQLIFGYNPMFFHIITFFTQGAVIVFLFKLIQRVTNRALLAFVSVYIYGIHAVHLVSLSWLAAYSFVLGPLTTVAVFFLYTQKRYGWALLVFIAGLLTTELQIILPVGLLAYHFFRREKIKIFPLTIFILVSGCFFYIRFVAFQIDTQTNLYQLGISNTIATTKFYILQLLGFPMLVTHMPIYFLIPTVLSGFSFLMILGIGFLQFFKTIQNHPWWIYFFGFIGFLYVTPFLFLPNHIAPHYLSFALIGISVILAYLIELATNHFFARFKTVFVLYSFFILQYFNILWTYQTHWIFRRAHSAQILVEKQQLDFPVGSEEYFSLGANAASFVFKQ